MNADEPVMLDTDEYIPPENGDDHFQDFIESGLDGDGIGIDDYAYGQDDENLDTEPNVEDEPSAQCKPMPVWLRDEIDEKITFLKKTDSAGCPILYSQYETFWLPMKCGWFKRNNSRRMYPSLLYHPQFFYWNPLYLVKIKCPNCETNLTQHSGFLKHPCRCFDVNGLMFILDAQYKCPQCIKSINKNIQKTFMSWDSRI